MYYNRSSSKGKRCSSIPCPNPRKVEFLRKSSLDDVFLRAKELYFGETANLTEMTLADSSGMLVEVDRAKWTLEEYYKDNDLKPSRHKMYIVYDIEGVRIYCNIQCMQ